MGKLGGTISTALSTSISGEPGYISPGLRSLVPRSPSSGLSSSLPNDSTAPLNRAGRFILPVFRLQNGRVEPVDPDTLSDESDSPLLGRDNGRHPGGNSIGSYGTTAAV